MFPKGLEWFIIVVFGIHMAIYMVFSFIYVVQDLIAVCKNGLKPDWEEDEEESDEGEQDPINNIDDGIEVGSPDT